ncbi:hypothetical protein BD413DRAFT_86453 [Trametes elegans]|nr:hypothetical protein BD413DRAFT_86453 [Trametes elegans]
MSTRHSFLSTTGLIRAPSVSSVAESVIPERQVRPGGTRPGHRRTQKLATSTEQKRPVNRAKAGIIPLGPAVIVGFAVLLSILFILAITCAFIPDEQEESLFARMLDDVAADTPGIVLIGEDVDVDVDEPALTIRWSIIACGGGFVLSGSEGTHGSANCGLPSMPLAIFVDGGLEAAASYDPGLLPYLNSTGRRNRIQNMFQFDDDHVLDVHLARMYPFDTYLLTSTLRAVSTSDNSSLPIQRLATITLTSSFVTTANDAPSFTSNADGSQAPSRDLVMRVVRPAEARGYALLLFATSWMLVHATVALVAFSWRVEGTEKILKHLASTLLVVLLIPQLRNAMPDAPGFDGVLIDSIGFFPQMLISSTSALMLIIMMVKRELETLDDIVVPVDGPRKEAPGPLSTGLLRMRRGSASVDISHMRSLSRSFAGYGRPAGG